MRSQLQLHLAQEGTADATQSIPHPRLACPRGLLYCLQEKLGSVLLPAHVAESLAALLPPPEPAQAAVSKTNVLLLPLGLCSLASLAVSAVTTSLASQRCTQQPRRQDGSRDTSTDVPTHILPSHPHSHWSWKLQLSLSWVRTGSTCRRVLGRGAGAGWEPGLILTGMVWLPWRAWIAA